MPNPYYIEPADIVGRFRQGAGEARVGQGRYADAARIDPANANSYMALEDRATARQDRQEQRQFGRSYADAYNRGDYTEAGNVAAQHGSIEGVTAARTGRQEASEQERIEAWRALQGYATRLEALEGNPNAQAEWGAMLEEAIAGSAQSPELQAEIQRFPRDWSVARTRVPGIVRTWMDRLLTPQQVAQNELTERQRATQERQADIAERRATAAEMTAAAAMRRADNAGSGVNARGEQQLRREFEGTQSEFRQVRDSYAQIRELQAGGASAGGDLAFIFSYMKMLDPGSVVREGEFANAQNAAGVPDQIRNMYNRVMSGQRLNDRQRDDFATQASRVYEARRRQYERDASQFRRYANEYGYDADRVVRDMTLPGEVVNVQTPEQASELAPGTRYRTPDGEEYVR